MRLLGTGEFPHLSALNEQPSGPDSAMPAMTDDTLTDQFRHGRRHWCSTRCGDRARAARAYSRRARSEAG